MEKLHELMMLRRTIHNYKKEPISRELLYRALGLGLYAPNHKHTQPWRYTLIGKEGRREITKLGLEAKIKAKPDMTHQMKEKVKEKFNFPAELVVLGCLKSEDSFRAREDYASVACAVQNISLYLWGHGIGTKWSTGGLTRLNEVYELAKIDKEVEEIVGFLWVGWPAMDKVPTPPKQTLSNALKETK